MAFDYDPSRGEQILDLSPGSTIRVRSAKLTLPKMTTQHFAAGLIVYRVPPGSVIAHEVARFTNSQDAVSFAQEKSK